MENFSNANELRLSYLQEPSRRWKLQEEIPRQLLGYFHLYGIMLLYWPLQFSLLFINFQQSSKFKRDLKFSISSILLNIIYLFLNLPRSLFTLFLTQNQPGLFFTIYFFYLSFAANFYLVLVSNSLFRKEFVLFLKDLFKCFKKR